MNEFLLALGNENLFEYILSVIKVFPFWHRFYESHHCRYQKMKEEPNVETGGNKCFANTQAKSPKEN